MAALTDVQMEKQINDQAAADQAAADTAAAVGYTAVNPVGAVTVDAGGKAPAYSTTAQGPVVAGSAALSAPSNFTATPQTQVVSVKDSNGNVIGVNQTTYSWDGSIATQNFIPATVAATGATGATGTPSQQNASNAMIAQLVQWGVLSSSTPTDATQQALISTINNLAVTGAGADTISLAVQNSQVYQNRFSANATRVANGLAALTPADYIATEQAYNQVLNAAGIQSGTNNDTAVWNTLLSNDVSASELQSRVDLAKQSITNADPYYTASLQNLYGLSSSDMIAYVLNPKNALPALQQQVNASQIAAEAARVGSGIGLPLATQLAGQGVTQAQAASGFQQISYQQPALQSIASMYGNGIINPNSVGQAQQAAQFGTTVGGTTAAQAQQELYRLQMQQTNAFSGSAGAGTGSLGPKDIGGSI